ncbi:MAG: ATP-binding cassette domain-containing protein [Leptospiraceae bacterium]|nr:ATP-binding cassette domain-containing protein [Leptospiraceae bacterium]
MEAEISIRELSLHFQKREIFHNLSFEVYKSEKILLTAKSGGGKSSLFKILLGFEKASSGTVYIQGIELKESNIMQIRSLISFIPQEPPLIDKTVNEFYEEVFNYKANKLISCDENLKKSMAMKLFGERNIFSENLSKLSVGERKRVVLILAFLLKREILFLDELSAGLDKKVREVVEDLLNQYEGCILFSSHDKSPKTMNWKELSW